MLPPFTIIVPAYNEEDGISSTLKELLELGETEGTQLEVIVVDDGSTDGTAAKLEAFSQSIRIFTHERNRGYGASLRTGLLRANYDWIVITDADGTYPNERIPDLLQSTSDNDMVVGSRTGEDVEYSRVRKLPKLFLTAFASYLSQSQIPDMNSGLRAFRKEEALRFLHLYPDGFSFTTTITMAFMTSSLRVLFVPINYSARIGKSKIQPIRDTLRFFSLIIRTGMYFAPLRVLTPILIFLSLLATASVCYDLIWLKNLTDKSVLLVLGSIQTAIACLFSDMIHRLNFRR